MPQIDMMKRYPKTDRKDSLSRSSVLSPEQVAIAKSFGRDYFDGPRELGLGGYFYNPKYFKPVVQDFYEHYSLSNFDSILDIGCAKGFMLHDFRELDPTLKLCGVDISSYCLENAMPSIKNDLFLASCDKLDFEDSSFDLVIAIATIHNLNMAGVEQSLREIVRVTRRNAFIKVNGYRNEQERKMLEGWNIVAETILHVDAWKELFEKTGYVYDYDFFVP